ncbi:MAG: hypothetical protein M1825_001366 [Sarcosagium campestre]|nr:MAG: hypothetical protein M1825_001366 [Sarcosagium campestre]
MASTAAKAPIEVPESRNGDATPDVQLSSNNPYNTPRGAEDPFLNVNHRSQRFSQFDAQRFAVNPTRSPSQAKGILEAHLSETEKRIADASKLGTTLVQQRKDLTQRLKDLESKQGDGEIGPELQQKLQEMEAEYIEVGRESARAFLGPKSRVSSGDGPEAPVTPSTFTSQATNSPSKLNVPSRKSRNQPSNRVHDIEFATEIGTSLLSQVRGLQAVLAERDETLKTVEAEKSRLEDEAESLKQRLRSMDESEQRYKDENWNLETHTHELMAAAKESAEREQKINQGLRAALAEKTAIQRELDDLKLTSAKLTEDHSTLQKQHDIDVSALRRNLNAVESEKTAMARRQEELTSQNQELARGLAARTRQEEPLQTRDLDEDNDGMLADITTPEGSPPPSPSKGTPRHSMLESETLKSSLHHAHRMIQNLKGNIHREKTEKSELKRLLQEARDELDIRRTDGTMGGAGNAGKRRKTGAEKDQFKKPGKPNLLGGGRAGKNEVLDDVAWEDQTGEESPSRRAAARSGRQSALSSTDMSDDFETANEREDGTTDAFQTGVESMGGDSSDQDTETEGGPNRRGTIRGLPAQAIAGNRNSFMSTASTSADEEEKVAGQPQQRFRVRLGRGGNRRSKFNDMGTPESATVGNKDSPASFMTNSSSQPALAGQSLFAELGDMNGEDESDDGTGSTPGRKSTHSRQTTPGSRPVTRGSVGGTPSMPTPRRAVMVDNGTMTDRQDASSNTPSKGVLGLAAGAIGGIFATKAVESSENLDQKDVVEGDSSTAAQDATTPLQVSGISSTDTVPAPLTTGDTARTDPSQPLALSVISSQAISPDDSAPALPQRDSRRIDTRQLEVAGLTDDGREQRSETSTPKSGLFGSMFGMRKSQTPPRPLIAEDSTSNSPRESRDSPAVEPKSQPFKDISSNIGQRELDSRDSSTAQKVKVPAGVVADQASQTTLSASQIDSMLKQSNKRTSAVPTALGLAITEHPSKAGAAAHDAGRARARGADQVALRDEAYSTKTSKRPGSSGSVRSSISTHPPLPPDHKQAIAAAAQRVSLSEPGTGTMGPPLAPASAYRASNSQLRPRTPSRDNQHAQPLHSPASLSKAGTTPRARHHSTARSDVSSFVTRRSSVSSFASELDERFNIRIDGMPVPQGLQGPGTDPRMIQAITQTMIGEYLWKYTRKAGRGEMSTNRHRRFFWVHPYTRTLYWSDRDPASAGRAELKAKSVAIDAVRVETDDNPMPPGLHRKSLIILTPGRSVKFTATTGQRHETWFNALSYLLLRTNPDGEGGAQGGVTSADAEEFNPGYGSRMGRHQAPSLSSYNSRTTRNTSPPRTAMSQSSNTTSRLAATPSAMKSTSSRNSQSTVGPPGSISRLSQMFKPGSTLRGSFSSRKSGYGPRRDASIYEASEVHDSAEDLRQVIERQEQEADHLENVRACCDGKHDVGQLSNKPGHGSQRHSHSHSHPNVHTPSHG